MSHNYLLELYDTIDERLERIDRRLQEDPSVDRDFEQGRRHTLRDLSAMLQERFNPKLPKRLRAKLVYTGSGRE